MNDLEAVRDLQAKTEALWEALEVIRPVAERLYDAGIPGATTLHSFAHEPPEDLASLYERCREVLAWAPLAETA